MSPASAAAVRLRSGVAAGQGTGDLRLAYSIGLWVFMGVAASLFSLFLMAYVMRMQATDWSTIALPRAMWLSTALLVAASAALQRASTAARTNKPRSARWLLFAGGLGAVLFLAVQLLAWQMLLDARVALAGNPAASFFYLLTALHGLHVLGGLLAWGRTVQVTRRPAEIRDQAWRITLCARYWHFLLGVWGALFATLGWLTPEVVAFICGTT